ncbi:TetR/AcrR family transcriptional regulator [Mycobacterium simiae]|uniref:TetR/AcrR family transcriptional regulator n=1 Tax=Mycobacterium simiae TaxID=1784 RepID=UPI00262F8402|nr:TetR/AcrR family transcriptional regulator [Mycobacterium simiae]
MSTTADRLMDLAEAHIRHAGYNGFSFRDLAAEGGVKSSSVHHHFPTKAQLAATVTRRYTASVLAAIAEAVDVGGAEPVVAYRSLFRDALRADGGMCLGGALGAEIQGLPAEVAFMAGEFFRSLADDLTHRLDTAGPRARALHILATLEGALILARSLGDVDAFDQATAALG